MAKSNDLTGEQFGMLTVVEATGEYEERYLTWRCRCACGGEIIVNTKRLKRGTVKNCGCIKKTKANLGSIAEDLTGKVFGRLSVLSRVENRNGRTCWLCQCSCGNLHTATAHELKSGSTRSCGCLRTLSLRQRGKDLTGQRFGRLIAVHPTEQRDSKGSVYWLCRCDCGSEVSVTQDNLVYGNYRSCGCLKEEIKTSINEKLTFVDNTCIEWLKSRKSRSDNTSGFRGVYQTPKGTWTAVIGLQQKRYYIGTYKTFEAAVNARKRVEELLHDGFVEAFKSWEEKAALDPKWAEQNPFEFIVRKDKGVFYVSTYTGSFYVSA